MRHVAIAAVTACLALAITFLLSTYGAHGVRGWIAVYFGYPGAFLDWRLKPGRMNYTLITVVNWLTYFVVAEAISVVFSVFLHREDK
jgi:hypothetical protein